jgi:cytochrome b561
MTLHWVIAVLLLLDFALAMSFSRFNPGDALYLRSAYDLHMSFGLCVALLPDISLHRRGAYAGAAVGRARTAARAEAWS